jgi:hypothetical protein
VQWTPTIETHMNDDGGLGGLRTIAIPVTAGAQDQRLDKKRLFSKPRLTDNRLKRPNLEFSVKRYRNGDSGGSDFLLHYCMTPLLPYAAKPV